MQRWGGMSLRFTVPLLLWLAAGMLSACGGSGRVRYDSPMQAYERGVERFDQGKYDQAIEYLQGVFDYGRTSEVAANAQFYLARAHFENREYILASSEFTRFLNTYRTDPRAEQVSFERARAYYHLSPQHELDQTNTRQAVTYFQLFLDQYPESSLRDQAEESLRDLREKLAQKEFAAAALYERRGIFEAAALSYVRVFDEYPDTPWADDALLGAMRAYVAFADRSIESRRPERLREAIGHYDRLRELFGDSPLMPQAEALYQRAVAQLG